MSRGLTQISTLCGKTSFFRACCFPGPTPKGETMSREEWCGAVFIPGCNVLFFLLSRGSPRRPVAAVTGWRCSPRFHVARLLHGNGSAIVGGVGRKDRGQLDT